ncbi:cation:proton antiporter regulatory subunit [Paenibacillus sp. y28]|uniref:cation:proton antiporter regulatory subunit n=1 Tax=Paenibacillus sp. y28 TaxID=3129110 RepID=UPI00301A4211
MNLKEIDLPGIGRKYSLITEAGDHLVVIVHNDERRELYHMNADDPDEVQSVLTLDDEEARVLSSIIGGMTYKPKALEQLEMVLDGLIIEWIRVDTRFQCIGRPIGELNIRQKTGATIIAVQDKSRTTHISPGPDHIFTAGATVVVAGERTQLSKLKQLLLDGGR